jgi:hypothetical protein
VENDWIPFRQIKLAELIICRFSLDLEVAWWFSGHYLLIGEERRILSKERRVKFGGKEGVEIFHTY